MDNTQIFALRLKNARTLKNMSRMALSEALGGIVSPQAIYKYESGKMLPSSKVIIELSRIFEVSMDYFFRPITATIKNVEFRKKYKLGAKERKSIESRAEDILERFMEINEICNKPLKEFTISEGLVSTKEDVLSIAANLRSKWNIPDDGIDNVIAFLESLGIIVIEIGATMDFDGFSGMSEKTPIIVLNKDYPSERKRFTALHELGHLVMRFESNVTDKEVEKFCHLFAGEMLIPASQMKSKLGDISQRKFSLKEFANLQKIYGISIDALMHKALDFGFIGDSKYRNYNILKRTNKLFSDYAEKSRYVEEHTDRFEKMVYRAYADELITGSKASSLLGISMQDMMENAMWV